MASYEQRDNKLWTVRFRYIHNGLSVQKRLSGFATKKLAKEAYIDFVSVYKNAPKITTERTLNDFWSEYIVYMHDRVKETTIFTYESDYNKHLASKLGDKKLNEINKLVVLDWQTSMNKDGYSYQYKVKIRNLLSNIFDYAVMYHDFPNNPVKLVENFRKVNEQFIEKTIWSFEQFNLFISNVDDRTYYSLFNMLYYAGLRKSEAFALQWSDINFKTNKVTISKTLSRKVKGSAWKVLDTPKSSNGNRTIVLPSVLMNILSACKYNDINDFVFGGDKPLAENTVSRTMDRYIKKANTTIPPNAELLPRITPHELRHSHASYLISNGISIVTVSKRLGHASIEETLKTYTHLMPNDEEKILELYS